jgi:hypothetical protein
MASGTGWPIVWSRSATSVPAEIPLRVDVKHDPFLDDRLKVANLPEEPQTLTVRNSISGKEKQLKIALFRKAGETAGARRAVSEIVKWANHVTDNRVLTLAPTSRNRSTSSTAASGATTILKPTRWGRGSRPRSRKRAT